MSPADIYLPAQDSLIDWRVFMRPARLKTKSPTMLLPLKYPFYDQYVLCDLSGNYADLYCVVKPESGIMST